MGNKYRDSQSYGETELAQRNYARQVSLLRSNVGSSRACTALITRDKYRYSQSCRVTEFALHNYARQVSLLRSNVGSSRACTALIPRDKLSIATPSRMGKQSLLNVIMRDKSRYSEVMLGVAELALR